MDQSVKEIIEKFQAEIARQLLYKATGVKGAGDLANTLSENLRDFARNYGLEQCECCGDYSEDCEATRHYDNECALCREDKYDMDATYSILKQVR